MSERVEYSIEDDRMIEAMFKKFWANNKKFREPRDENIMRLAFEVGFKVAAEVLVEVDKQKTIKRRLQSWLKRSIKNLSTPSIVRR